MDQPEKMVELCDLPLLSSTFDSLPYLMSENDWIEVTKFKKLAILREEQLMEKRRKRHEELLQEVSNRLETWGNKRHGNSNKEHSNKSRTTNQSGKMSGIPVRSPPKPTQVQLFKPKEEDLTHQSVYKTHTTGYYRHHPLKYTNRRPQNPADRFSALVKGFITRRLLTSEKIQDIVKTIKDAEHVLQDLESPSSMQEFDLQQRVINQLQAAKQKLHFIFFDASPKDKMAYITHSRILRKEKQLRRLEALQDVGIKGRLSTATLKSMERKKKDSPINLKKQTTKKPVKKEKEEGNVMKHESSGGGGRKRVTGTGTGSAGGNRSSVSASSSSTNTALRKKTISTNNNKVKQPVTASKNITSKIPSLTTRKPHLSLNPKPK